MRAFSIFLLTGKLNSMKLIYISSSFLLFSFFYLFGIKDIIFIVILHFLLSIYLSLPIRLKNPTLLSEFLQESAPYDVWMLSCKNASHEQQKNTFFLLLLTLFRFMFLALWNWASWGRYWPIPCKATGSHSLKIKWKEHFFLSCGISFTYKEINREVSLFFNENQLYFCACQLLNRNRLKTRIKINWSSHFFFSVKKEATYFGIFTSIALNIFLKHCLYLVCSLSNFSLLQRQA